MVSWREVMETYHNFSPTDHGILVCVQDSEQVFHYFITGDATEYSKHLFRVLDTDKDNMVSWREVMVGFHQLSPSGDPDQKLKLVYSVSTIVQ